MPAATLRRVSLSNAARSPRAVGTGFAYHVGAGLGAFTPYLIGAMQDRGLPLPNAMWTCIMVAGVLVIGMLRLGPETRGTRLEQA